MISPGMHLLVDGLTRMSFTVDYLELFLRDAVGMVGMKVVMGPFVLGNRNTWDGWAALEASHAAIHVQGEQCYVDLFSCQWFDVTIPLELMRHRLKLSTERFEVIERIKLGACDDR